MKPKKSFNLADLDTMTGLIDAVFSEMNLGLLIYQMEDLDDVGTLKLVYANKQASKYTGTDLSILVGKYLAEAFPPLAQTDIPQQYAQVIRSKQSRTIGALQYGDVNVDHGYYAIRAFPMPNDCAGILLENITLRKQLEDLVKNYSEQARAEEAKK
ncbi:PAS domain-containing protein [candidate division KSB1 bacterium]|nr:PAS domain-containing protein [candidate division KSB1 bacterium]